MTTYDDQLQHRAKQILSDTEIRKMEHCVGYDPHKCYHRRGVRYFRPYRNHFYPGGTDVKIWEAIQGKGFAESGEPDSRGGKYFWLNLSGLNILSAAVKTYIYSDNARGNEIDASHDVIEVLLADAVYCGYGCWIPSGSADIAKRARLPKKLTLDTLRYLRDKCGYVRHDYEGGCDDEGFPHCTHGWSLTKKWIDENKERYEKAQQEEYKRIDEQLRGGQEDEHGEM